MTAPLTPAERETPAGEAMREAVARDYVLVKRGVYYMPKANGYTGVLDEAGRYTEAEAQVQTGHCDGVTAILASEAPRFSEACWSETRVKVLQVDLAKAASELARLTAERDEARGEAERLRFEIETIGDVNDELEEQAEEDAAALTSLRAEHAAEVARLKAQREAMREALKEIERGSHSPASTARAALVNPEPSHD